MGVNEITFILRKNENNRKLLSKSECSKSVPSNFNFKLDSSNICARRDITYIGWSYSLKKM